jgi:putative transposase
MLLTYKLKHGRDFSAELEKAFRIAEFAVKSPKCPLNDALLEGEHH